MRHAFHSAARAFAGSASQPAEAPMDFLVVITRPGQVPFDQPMLGTTRLEATLEAIEIGGPGATYTIEPMAPAVDLSGSDLRRIADQRMAALHQFTQQAQLESWTRP